jgi:hypothetical protein
MNETCLGDGLYVSFNGSQVILRVPRAEGDHRVALEPDVMIALQRYLADLARKHPELRRRSSTSPQLPPAQPPAVWVELREKMTRLR